MCFDSSRYIQHNELETLPTELRYLTSLNVLLVQENKYDYSLYIYIKELLLIICSLHDIPCEIGFLPIQHINIDKNPIPTDITALVQKNHIDLLNHLQKGINSNSSLIYLIHSYFILFIFFAEFERKQASKVVVLQRRYRLHLKTRRFFNIVKLVVATDKQAKLG